jgi:dienelactone hydrolase
MQKVCQSLAECGFDVLCPDLLQRESHFDYAQEEDAYRYFMEKIGFPKACLHVKKWLKDSKNQYKKIFVLGFSVGATVAWMCSEERQLDGIVGYYGSRIRDFLKINPRCPALLFFPQEEKSFHVDEVMAVLNAKDNVEAHKCNGNHGFSDPYSPKYDEQSAKQTCHMMMAFLRKHNQG